MGADGCTLHSAEYLGLHQQAPFSVGPCNAENTAQLQGLTGLGVLSRGQNFTANCPLHTQASPSLPSAALKPPFINQDLLLHEAAVESPSHPGPVFLPLEGPTFLQAVAPWSPVSRKTWDGSQDSGGTCSPPLGLDAEHRGPTGPAESLV